MQNLIYCKLYLALVFLSWIDEVQPSLPINYKKNKNNFNIVNYPICVG